MIYDRESSVVSREVFWFFINYAKSLFKKGKSLIHEAGLSLRALVENDFPGKELPFD
jgi:hypothetical protein